MSFSLPDLFSRIRVPVGFLLAGFYFYFSRPTWRGLFVGGSIAFLGLLLRGWATGHLRKDDQLAVTGPYAFTRNPLYFGSFLIGIGFSLAGRNPIILVVFLASFATLYGPVMQKEMNHVRRLFSEEYADYQKKVPLFFPRLWPHQRATGAFSFQRYLKNREYQALLGFLAAIGLLVLKIQR
ncbi:MAG: protein-S-isoprenylcysteine methyltransferase [Acidobacteria bacterium]|nr:MAG: protein-S-isoprenylcysteine methyltransferase [Acidobacteriota bacterium]